MIVIVNYGAGNLGSMLNMFKKIGQDAILGNTVEDIEKADKLILPGVGSFDAGMEKLNSSGLKEILNFKVLEEKVPILGICLGLQLMTNNSEEGILDGLGWIDANTQKFQLNSNQFKIPHMGWNEVKIEKKSKLFEGMEEEDNRFYFVHSYHLMCSTKDDILVSTHYGYDFTCGVKRSNILGVQFHPEKSHKFGMQLLRNFSQNY
jgi:glutamine amidotransferase